MDPTNNNESPVSFTAEVDAGVMAEVNDLIAAVNNTSTNSGPSLFDGQVDGSQSVLEQSVNPTQVPSDLRTAKAEETNEEKTKEADQAVETVKAIETQQVQQTEQVEQVEELVDDDVDSTVSELEALRAQVNSLKGLLNDVAVGRPLVQEVGQTPSPTPSPQAVVANAPVAQPQPPVPLYPTSIPTVTEDTFTEILTSPEAFNTFIANVVGTVRQQAVIEAQENAITRLRAEQQFDSFCAQPDNEDLLAVKDFFHQYAIGVEARNPGLGLKKVLETARDEIREKIGFVAQVKGGDQTNVVRRRRDGKPVVNRAPARPTVPKPKVTTSAPRLDPQAQYLNEILNGV